MERTWRRFSPGGGCDSLILPVRREKATRCEVRELMIRSLGSVGDSIMGALLVYRDQLCKNEKKAWVHGTLVSMLALGY